MATYAYRAVDADGRRARGVVEARSADEATAVLVAEGFELRRLRERKAFGEIEITRTKVKPALVMHFSRQLAAFIRAGVPIIEAIEVVIAEMQDKTFRKVLADVVASLRRGVGVAESFSGHSNVFPPFYVSILRSAEITGQLDVVLDQLSRYIERDLEARNKIRSALFYPALVVLMSIVTVIVLATFVLPRFKVFFAQLNAELPLPTRMLLAATRFITDWGPTIVALFLLAVAVFGLSTRTRPGRHFRDAMLLRIPAVGPVAHYIVIERFCRILASMVRAGIPVPEALEIAAAGAHNLVFRTALADAREEVLQGQGLSRPIARTGLFPPAVTSMIRVGEDTGSLDDQLDSMASYYEKELEYKIKKLTTLFEPIAIVVVGGLVGFVALALVSALYGVYNQVDIR